MAKGIDFKGAVWVGFFGLILTAWVLLFTNIVMSPLYNIPGGLWQALCSSAQVADIPTLFSMWLLMMAAMMLPSFVPALRTFLDLGTAGTTRTVDAVALCGGYATVWAGGALLGAMAQSFLSAQGFLAPNGSSLSLWFSAALLLTTGLYQLSVVKSACLAHCKMPLTFFLQRWAPGVPRAFRMGLELGVLCFGCCWALMALAFVGGTMNLLWMGGATLFMVLEKLPDVGRVLTRPAGYLLLLASGVTALSAIIS